MKIKKYTPTALKELMVRDSIIAENYTLSFDNQVIDLLTDCRMTIILALGQMVEKVQDAPDGEAKQFWAKEIGKINTAIPQLTRVENYFFECEAMIRRLSIENADLLQTAKGERERGDRLEKLMKEQELLNS